MAAGESSRTPRRAPARRPGRAPGRALLDDLVRPAQQQRRDRETERLGRLEVDDTLEVGGLLVLRLARDPCTSTTSVARAALGPVRPHSRVLRPRSTDARPLLVEPHLLHAAPTVDGLVRNQVLHIRPHSVVVEPPAQHRADRSLLELSLDHLNQREALGWVQLLRLLIHQPRDRLVAVTGIVARRPAAVVFVEVGVRVVRLDTGPLYPDLKVAARLQRMPLGRLHLPEGRLDADVLQLI